MRIGVSLEIVVRLFLYLFADLSFLLLSNISRRFRIGYGKTQNGETALSVITTTLLTLCDPVSMTEAISLLEVSVQKSH